MNAAELRRLRETVEAAKVEAYDAAKGYDAAVKAYAVAVARLDTAKAAYEAAKGKDA